MANLTLNFYNTFKEYGIYTPVMEYLAMLSYKDVKTLLFTYSLSTLLENNQDSYDHDPCLSTANYSILKSKSSSDKMAVVILPTTNCLSRYSIFMFTHVPEIQIPKSTDAIILYQDPKQRYIIYVLTKDTTTLHITLRSDFYHVVTST